MAGEAFENGTTFLQYPPFIGGNSSGSTWVDVEVVVHAGHLEPVVPQELAAKLCDFVDLLRRVFLDLPPQFGNLALDVLAHLPVVEPDSAVGIE